MTRIQIWIGRFWVWLTPERILGIVMGVVGWGIIAQPNFGAVPHIADVLGIQPGEYGMLFIAPSGILIWNGQIDNKVALSFLILPIFVHTAFLVELGFYRQAPMITSAVYGGLGLLALKMTGNSTVDDCVDSGRLSLADLDGILDEETDILEIAEQLLTNTKAAA